MSDNRDDRHDDASNPYQTNQPVSPVVGAPENQQPLTSEPASTTPVAPATPLSQTAPTTPVTPGAPVAPVAPISQTAPTVPLGAGSAGAGFPAPSAGQTAYPSAPQGAAAPAYGATNPAQGTFGGHTHHPQYGAAFGSPTASAASYAAPTPLGVAAEPKRKSRTGMFVGALVVGALVCGAAGLGGAWAGQSLFATSASQSASGPQTVTINNPDSVNQVAAVATKVLPSVVTISVDAGQSGGTGSGVVLSSDGYVLTNTHVVTLGGQTADGTIHVTTSDGRIYTATVVGLDPLYDLAVIKLTDASGLTPVTWGDSTKLNVGETAVALGAPLGLDNTVTQGIVSALNRSIQIQSSAVPDSTADQSQQDQQQNGQSPFQFDLPGQQTQTQSQGSISISVIQTDAAINPGNSGGALVDGEGKLIGINVAIASAGSSSASSESGNIGVGFAIPASVAQRVAEEIISNGSASHGLLGAMVGDASAVEGATIEGAVISSGSSSEAGIVAGGAAEAAGLKEGDIITEFNGVPITSGVDLTAQVRAAAAGATVPVTYVRDGKTEETTVTLGTLK